MTNEELAAAITQAIRDGFASLDTSSPSPTPSPSRDTSTERSTEITTEGLDLPDVDEERKKRLEERKKTIADLKRAGGITTGLLGGAAKMIGDTAVATLDAVADLNEELDDELSYFRQIQEGFGGISLEAFAAGEAVGGLAGQALEAQLHLGMVGAAGKDMTLEIETGAMAGKNALLELFKEPAEAALMFNQVLVDVAATNTTLAKSLQEQGEAEMERIAIIRKRMGVDERTMGNILRRQYAFTGEASAKIFEDIASVSVALAEQTGGAAEDLKGDILAIMQDTKLFGDIGVDAAGRISASLNTLGLDFQTFKNMTSQFMDFNSAAEKMGDLSALFGIQMDAMEMTYLANEDQEEFLFRMREEILDAGLDVENMSKTRQRALTEQLGLDSIEQMRQFMDTGIQPDQQAMQAATDSAETMDGMATAIEQFGGAYEGSYRGAAEFEKSLRNQARYTESVARDIAKVREEAGLIPGEFQDFKLPKSTIENARKMLSLDFKALEGFRTKLEPVFKGLAEKTAEFSADLVSKGLDAAGVKVLSSGDLNVKSTVTHKLDDEATQQVTQVAAAASRSEERSAEIEVMQQTLLDNALINQARETRLMEAMEAEKNINVTIEMNENVAANRIFNLLQREKGIFVMRQDQ